MNLLELFLINGIYYDSGWIFHSRDWVNSSYSIMFSRYNLVDCSLVYFQFLAGVSSSLNNW